MHDKLRGFTPTDYKLFRNWCNKASMLNVAFVSHDVLILQQTEFSGFDTDVDQCASNNGGCHNDATCTNNHGSITCTCNTGYAGDGVTCSGQQNRCLLCRNALHISSCFGWGVVILAWFLRPRLFPNNSLTFIKVKFHRKKTTYTLSIVA